MEFLEIDKTCLNLIEMINRQLDRTNHVVTQRGGGGGGQGVRTPLKSQKDRVLNVAAYWLALLFISIVNNTSVI